MEYGPSITRWGKPLLRLRRESCFNAGLKCTDKLADCLHGVDLDHLGPGTKNRRYS
jgi:hypothetical protein